MLAPEQMTTENLLLERICRSHLEGLHALYSDPDVMRYVYRGKAFSKEETMSWLEEKLKYWTHHGYGPYAFIDRSTREFIGRGGLSTWDNTDRIEIGFALKKSHWGRGLASEAGLGLIKIGFESLELNELYATLRKANLGSKKTVEKIGMRYLGEELYLGAPALVYCILRGQKL